MKAIVFLLLTLGLTSCNHAPSNEIDALAEKVISKKEGVDIRVMPVDPEKK